MHTTGMVKVKISYIYFKVEYADYIMLEKMRLLNNHRKDAKSEKSILARKHFNQWRDKGN